MPEKIFEDAAAAVWCADCLEHPGLWADADVLVTDPPYGIAWRQRNLRTKSGKSDSHPGIASDSDTSARDRVLELWGPDRRAVVFGSPVMPPPAGTRQGLVFLKGVLSGVRGAFAGCRRDVEMIHLVGPWKAGIGGRSSVFTTMALTRAGSPQAQYGHPHAKPVDMVEELLSCVLAGETGLRVADPFAGSGSVLVAARNVGHRVVGVELVRGHCVTAGRRLGQGQLFV